jgi:hypothetical protein
MALLNAGVTAFPPVDVAERLGGVMVRVTVTT